MEDEVRKASLNCTLRQTSTTTGDWLRKAWEIKYEEERTSINEDEGGGDSWILWRKAWQLYHLLTGWEKEATRRHDNVLKIMSVEWGKTCQQKEGLFQ